MAVHPGRVDDLPAWRHDPAGVEARAPQRRSAAALAARMRPAAALWVVNAGIAVYAVGSIGLVATHRVGLTSEHAILLGLVAAGLVPRLRVLVRDWVPFLFIAVMFEDLGAIQPLVAGSVHAAGPAILERRILGADAAPWLQAHLGGLVGAVWWQLPLVGEYLAHFLAPLIAGAWLWWRHRSRFEGFVAAYTLVMAAGFAGYLLYPEMPPWLAAQHGLVPPVGRVVVSVLDQFGGFGALYSGADPFPDGAMPSLHVAVPMVIALTMMSGQRHRLSRLWLLYPLTISFAVVDLGEHYVSDVVVGLALGAACWAVVELVSRLAPRRATAGLRPAPERDAEVT